MNRTRSIRELCAARRLATEVAATRSAKSACADYLHSVCRGTLTALTVVLLLVGPVRPPAAGAEQSATDLAKASQNPIANVISVPFQNNFNFDAGTKDATVWNLNVEPVIPVHLSEDWNLITRTIVPIINQPELFSAGPRTEAFGMGDINPTGFLSPAKPGTFIWGVGPTLTAPTATVSRLGSGRWSAGPAAVGLVIHGPWLVGVLANQQWDFGGWSNKHVNQLLVQPFVNYNLAEGWYLTSVPIITANFSASGDNHWTVPVGGGAGKLTRVGTVGLPIDAQVQAFYNAETPEFGSDWQLRFQLKVLFPE